jgi:hypothetical protein
VSTPHRRLQFPIYFEEPNNWEHIVRDRLRDVPDDAVNRIWEVQPFHADQPNNQALAVVHSLSNEDKHHLILDSVSVPAEPDDSHFEVQTFDIDEPVHIDAVWGVPLRPGMTLLTVHYTPTGPHPKIDVATRAPAEVIFGEMGFRAAAMRGVAGELFGVCAASSGSSRSRSRRQRQRHPERNLGGLLGALQGSAQGQVSTPHLLITSGGMAGPNWEVDQGQSLPDRGPPGASPEDGRDQGG